MTTVEQRPPRAPAGIAFYDLGFRGVGSFDMKITESLARWARIVDEVGDQRHRWSPATEG
jgi:hypothetical protein